MLTSGNGFYLLKDDGYVNVFTLVDYKPSSLEAKPINNSELDQLKAVSYDYFISEPADPKAISKAIIIASKINTEQVVKEETSTIDLLTITGDEEYES